MLFLNIGEALYDYRNSLGLTLEEMAAGFLTTSYYSKVERGLHRISAEDLFNILEFHDIEVSYFHKKIQNDLEIKPFEKFNLSLQVAYFNGDCSALLSIRNEISNNKILSKESKKILYTLSEICESGLKGDFSIISQENKDFMRDKIFNLPNWDGFKLSLYANAMHSYDIESINSVVSTMMLRQFENFSSEEQIIVITIILNFIGMCLSNKINDLAKYYLQKISNIPATTKNCFHRLLIEFYNNVMNYIEKKDVQSKKHIEIIINSFELIGMENLSEQLSIFFKEMKH